uniref:Uncharacterized protein n=1 Tax=Ornithorhynchus anatinus TaxID=9258 RepID=A0A6I8PCX0_ORNAN
MTSTQLKGQSLHHHYQAGTWTCPCQGVCMCVCVCVSVSMQLWIVSMFMPRPMCQCVSLCVCGHYLESMYICLSLCMSVHPFVTVLVPVCQCESMCLLSMSAYPCHYGCPRNTVPVSQCACVSRLEIPVVRFFPHDCKLLVGRDYDDELFYIVLSQALKYRTLHTVST